MQERLRRNAEQKNVSKEFENKVKRVAAYCRVSTDNLDQANSLESRQRYFNEYIKRNPLWELYEIYVDERISRFARNTLDSIGYTRELKSYGNGSAMRVSPVGWFADSLKECAVLAAATAYGKLTHSEKAIQEQQYC
ncbi:MAG: ADP-ribosylglycohydrolase family protein [Acutalibacteraceae bacterium]